MKTNELRPHRVLPLSVERADGTRAFSFRVYCEGQGRSVSLEVCRSCPRSAGIESSDDGKDEWVVCAPEGGSDPERRAVGEVARPGVIAVEGDVPLSKAVAILVERSQSHVVVVDAEGRLQGVIREDRLLGEARPGPDLDELGPLVWRALSEAPAKDLMSEPACVAETTSLRDAILQMAAARERRLLVVDRYGAPLGILCDLDAMRAHNEARRG